MTIPEQENACLINHFLTLKREIALERDAQLISMAKLIGRDADLIIEKLRLLSQYQKDGASNGKATGQSAVS